ncbi:hypothetical protein GPA10_05340 [Streptomyces sp. p1417]|uniref:Uncharacterized protein n=1 Tax=Streptomyces typhae TaxID=2681492 RepID=A0A6L6WW21_9ACTN|nr:hypothetical protein [Streptomyces typhae]MVO84211.1 hypothetical protein [Streptomyces typhae]
MSATTAELNAAATRVYATYMDHLGACTPCQQMDHCPKGTRLRLSWKRVQGAAIRARLNRRGGAPCGT